MEGRNIFGKHIEKKKNRGRAFVGSIKSKAKDAYNSAEVADILWKSMACASLLYGVEVIKWNERIIDSL